MEIQVYEAVISEKFVQIQIRYEQMMVPPHLGNRQFWRIKTIWLCAGSATHFAHLWWATVRGFPTVQCKMALPVPGHELCWQILNLLPFKNILNPGRETGRVTRPPHLKEVWDTHHSYFLAMWWQNDKWHLRMCGSSSSQGWCQRILILRVIQPQNWELRQHWHFAGAHIFQIEG